MMRRAAGPAFTLFHALWLVGVGSSAYIGWIITIRHDALLRIAAAAAGAVAGAFVSLMVIVLLVTAVLIPRLTPRSRWHREVDGFMASLFGSRWGQ